MDPYDMMWRGVALPSLVSAFILVAGLRPWRRRELPPEDMRVYVFPLAIAVGYVCGHLALSNWSWPGFFPADTTHWPLFLVPAAGLFMPIDRYCSSMAAWGKWPLRTVMMAGAMIAVLMSQWRHNGLASASGWLIILTAGGLLWWGVMDGASKRLSPSVFISALIVILSGASVALVISNTGLLAQMVGALAAATGPLLVLGLWRGKTFSGAGPVLPVVAVGLASLWANGLLYTYAELQGISLLLIAAAVATLASGWMPSVRRMAASPRRVVRWTAATAPVIAAMVPLAAAVALAVSRSAEMVY